MIGSWCAPEGTVNVAPAVHLLPLLRRLLEHEAGLMQ
jgi:hypothetical protein